MHGFRAKYTLCCAAVCAAACLFGFGEMFRILAGVFSDPYEDMSFAWFVPAFSAYLLWLKRRAIRETAASPRPSPAALAAVAAGLFFEWIGRRGGQVRFEQLGFMILFASVPWALYGRRMARLFAPSSLFLVFTVSLGNFLGTVTVPLRLIAVSASEAILSGCGAEVARRGTVIMFGGEAGFSIDIVDGCSGLRSLFALLTLTAAFAWLNQPTLRRRAALMLFAVPIAIAGNVARIVSISAVGILFDKEFALGFYHDYSGFVTFAAGILLMLAASGGVTALSRRLSRASRRPAQAAPRPAAPAPAAEPGMVRAAAVPAAAALLCVAAFAALAALPPARYVPVRAVDLPESLLGLRSDIPAYCQNEQCGGAGMYSFVRLAEASGTNDIAALRCPDCGAALSFASLSENAILVKRGARLEKRIYLDDRGGPMFFVSALCGGESKGSMHRPELCLPAHGFLLTHPRDVEVAGIPFRVMTLRFKTRPSQTFAYTFFNQDGYRTCSHLARIWRDVSDRTFKGAIDGWAMVTVVASNRASPSGFNAEENPGADEEFRVFLRALATHLVPEKEGR